MQGIYEGYDLYTHDISFTCILDLVQRPSGMSSAEDAFELIELSGSAEITKE